MPSMDLTSTVTTEAEPADVGRWWWIRPVFGLFGLAGSQVNLGYFAGEVA